MAEMTVLTCRVPKPYAAAFRARAERESMNTSAVLRELVAAYINAPESEHQDFLIEDEELPMTG